jgi:hypothetical protein
MKKLERFWLDREFQTNPNHTQRCTEAAWRDALLHNQDRVKIQGTERRLVGIPMGFGVVEVKIKS